VSPIVRFIIAEVALQRKSAKGVSERAGYDKDLIHRWKSGANARLDAAEAILGLLGYSLTIKENERADN